MISAHISSAALHVETSTTPRAYKSDNPARGWVTIGPLGIHGTLEDLERVLRAAADAVADLTPTLDEFLAGAVSDCIEGR